MSDRQTLAKGEEGTMTQNDLDVLLGFVEDSLGTENVIAVFRKVRILSAAVDLVTRTHKVH